MSARLKLTLSYAAVVLVSGLLLLAAVGLYLLRYVPDVQIPYIDFFVPNRSDLIRAFVPVASVVMVVLLALGLGGGWLLAGRMLAPLERIGDAARLAAQGSLSHTDRPPRPPRRVPRPRRRLRLDARAAGGPRRRAAAVRRQCLARAAHPSRDLADAARGRPR